MGDEIHPVSIYNKQLADKDCNSDEAPFQNTRKEKVADLNTLKPGDHISLYRSDFSYAHHGIVCESRTKYLRVIHYFNTYDHLWNELMKGSLYIAEVTESEWPADIESTTEEIYLQHYDNITCYSNEETLERAFSQLGKRGYSLFKNNCEHWARWCRTGEHYSEQVCNAREIVKKKAATLLIIDPTALLIKDVALVGAQTFGQFLSAVGSGVVLTGVESVSTYLDIKRKNEKRQEGSLSEVAFKKYVVRRITSASTTIIGGTVGTVVGTVLIPVPIVGSAVGGIIGTVSGKFIGSIGGIAISKVLDVFEKRKAASIEHMSTVPLLMNNVTFANGLLNGLMSITFESEEEEQISNAIDQEMSSKSSSSYPALEELACSLLDITLEKCEIAKQLTKELFPESDSYDYFVLAPVPDENAPQEFASSVDLLVLRWSMDTTKPWESDVEQVLDIGDFSLNKE